ncbi:MAG TPA: hypothetical protein VIH86_00980 [Puia sp.]
MKKIGRYFVMSSIGTFLAFFPSKCVFRAFIGDEKADVFMETESEHSYIQANEHPKEEHLESN